MRLRRVGGALALAALGMWGAACEAPPPAPPPTIDVTLKIATGDILFDHVGPEGFVTARPAVRFTSLSPSCEPQIIEDRLDLRRIDEPFGFDGAVEWRHTGWELVGGQLRGRIRNQPWCIDRDNMVITIDGDRVEDGRIVTEDNVVVQADSMWAGTFSQATFVK